MATILSIKDLNTTVNHEPRIKDIVLAEKLGMERPTNIRQKIEANIVEFEMHGTICTEAVQIPNTAGRPAKAYYLNEAQALLLCMFSRTAKAAEVRKAIIEVYMAYRKGTLQSLPEVTSEIRSHITGCVMNAAEAAGAMRALAKEISTYNFGDDIEHKANFTLRYVENALKAADSLGRVTRVMSVSPHEKQGRLAIAHKPIDAKTIHNAVDEIYAVLGNFKMMMQQSSMSKATTRVQNILLDAAMQSCSSITKEVIYHC